jgi:hypothetical protein
MHVISSCPNHLTLASLAFFPALVQGNTLLLYSSTTSAADRIITTISSSLPANESAQQITLFSGLALSFLKSASLCNFPTSPILLHLLLRRNLLHSVALKITGLERPSVALPIFILMIFSTREDAAIGTFKRKQEFALRTPRIAYFGSRSPFLIRMHRMQPKCDDVKVLINPFVQQGVPN